MVCSLAGGIAGLSSAPFITNPAYAIAFGFGAAACQLIVHYIVLTLQSSKGSIGSFSFLYVTQGVLGILLAAINKSIVAANPNGLDYDWIKKDVDGNTVLYPEKKQ